MGELLKLLGLGTPFVYAAGVYAAFHWLDKNASDAAKNAIFSWFKPLEYDRVGMAAAIVNVFDRLYGSPLLSWRALSRSALFTIVFTIIYLYETYFLRAIAHEIYWEFGS